MADNFDLQGWMRENKQGPFAGFSSKKETFKSSKPKSKTGLNESLMGMIDLQPVGSLSEDLEEGAYDYFPEDLALYVSNQEGDQISFPGVGKSVGDHIDYTYEKNGRMVKLTSTIEKLQGGQGIGFNTPGGYVIIPKKFIGDDGMTITKSTPSMNEEAGKTIHVSSDDNFKVQYGGKDWTVEYDNHEVGDDIMLSSGSEKKTGVVKNVSPNGDITIELNETMYEMEDDDMEDDSTNTIDDLQLHLYNMQNVDDFEKVDFIYNNILDEPQQQAVDQMKNSEADNYDILSYLINDVLDKGDLKQVIDHFSDMDYSMNEDDEDDAPEIEDTWNKPSEFDKDDDEEKMAAMAMKQAKSGKKGMKGITADWTIDDILGDDDDDF